MCIKYEIDQIDPFWKGVSKDYKYIVVINLPYCSIPGPFRITTKTAEQARSWKDRKRITKISLWNQRPERAKKKKALKIIPNPVKLEELPELFLFWNRIFFKSMMYGAN